MKKVLVFWGLFVFLFVGAAWAASDDVGVPADQVMSNKAVSPAGTTGPAGPKTSWPLLPHETLNVPLPEKPGCFHLVDGSWQEAPCMTEEETKRLPPPAVADTIQSTSHKYNGETVTTPLHWGAVAIEIPDPQQSGEMEIVVSTDPEGHQTTLKSLDFWSIQANTNGFKCSSCSKGFPCPKSNPGDSGWVQFTYQQWGESGGPLCVWNVDATCNCYKTFCVTPTGTVDHLTGPGSSVEPYEVAGFVQCGYTPNTKNVGPNGCTLWVLGYLPNLQNPGWWAAAAPDNLGLGTTGNWTSIGGSLYGSDNGAGAVFTQLTSNSTVVNTTVVANSCFQSPTPSDNTVPIFTPSLCDSGEDQYNLSAAIAFAYGNGTAESNNLKMGDASLSCVDYECRMTWTGTADQSAPAIAVRTANPAGEADVVMWGPNNSLKYYHATPGSKWTSETIAGSGTTYSAPAIAVRAANPAGEADVVAMGPNNSLLYYHALPGKPWIVDTIAGSGTTYSAPAIAVRPTGEADVVAMGPHGSLMYYHALPGKPWIADTIAGSGTTYSAPAIEVRSTGEADIVAQGPSQSLRYYHAMPGYPWIADTIAGSAGKVFGTPAIGVNSATGRADIVWMGLYHSLYHTHAIPGSPWSAIDIIAGEESTFYPPAIAVRSTGEIDVVTTAWDGSLNYYFLLPNANWRSHQIAGLNNKSYPQLTVYPPAITVRSNGEADIVTIAAYELDYFWAIPDSGWSKSQIASPL
jgi:hypothetical protein